MAVVDVPKRDRAVLGTHSHLTAGVLCRRVAEQRSEIIQLADQISGLQSDVATSHAAHLALQQHHQETMKQAAAERQQMEELHKKTVETLHAVRVIYNVRAS